MTPGLHIGLTGGIGSGKSTVASFWVACGAVLVDTDAISRQLTTRGGAALPALAAAFGDDILAPDGALNRDRMRSLVFADVQQRLRLESILHPMISAQAQAQAHAAGSRPVVFDVPLLSENSHWRQRVARVLVVDCSYPTQVERVMRRNDWPADTVQKIIAQQVSRERRRRIADAVIFNENLDLDALRHEVQQLWQSWVGT
jgi:dephospho-CoA kinase